ncbi:alpha-ketoglutarate-dependent dioxygenase AlkB family protein [Pedobacter sp. GR22-6]|uniref:alpha-ketoglutarate-dependent dioxygenase AlkB family protein n=1 Tax=Pedobacter sp. GR22-6 TaxID=3127957 RepID=UPI00307F9C2A
MDLFNPHPVPEVNLLPVDGIVNYYGRILSSEKANVYLNTLLNKIDWENDKAVIFGKTILTKRKVAWYGDEPFQYTYSNTTKTALPWTEALLELKKLAQEHSGHSYNSCLLNLYHDGSEGMAWHSDGEKDLKKNGAIASFSFGAERKFAFRHKDNKQKISLTLEHGSLLVMSGLTQQYWQHRLPPTKIVRTARVNLTFRTIVENGKGI